MNLVFENFAQSCRVVGFNKCRGDERKYFKVLQKISIDSG